MKVLKNKDDWMVAKAQETKSKATQNQFKFYELLITTRNLAYFYFAFH